MSMPKAIRRKHYEPPWLGDRPIVLIRNKKAGTAFDQNYSWCQQMAFALHWPTPARNNFFFYLDPGAKRARRMTLKELRRPLPQWTDNQVKRWRRGPSARSARPWTYHEMVAVAKKHHAIIIAELKSPAFATAQAAEYMVSSAKAVGHPAWYMSLLSMKYCAGKACAIHHAGGEFAVIFGTHRLLARKPPANWAKWKDCVSQVWGANWSGK